MSRPMNLRLSSLLVFVALCCPGVTLGGQATDELLRYVPEEVGFCVVVQDLRGHYANLRASPFYQKWGKSFLDSECVSCGACVAWAEHRRDRAGIGR